MKTSHLYVILLTALVVQIPSETTAKPSELDKLLNSILSSSFEIVAKPISDLVKEIPVESEVENYLKEFTWKLKRFMEQTQEDFFNMIPKEERTNTKKIIGYLSMYVSEVYSKAAKSVATATNKSFETLPDDIKTKLLDIGNDINDYLRKLRVSNTNDSKTSQKTYEE